MLLESIFGAAITGHSCETSGSWLLYGLRGHHEPPIAIMIENVSIVFGDQLL